VVERESFVMMRFDSKPALNAKYAPSPPLYPAV
jgi:hypothetical protein